MLYLKLLKRFFNVQNINQALPKELPLFCCVQGVANKTSENNSKGRGVKNTKRDSSRSPARGDQLTFVDRHSSRHGQARRRSSCLAGRPFHASFVWCVSSCFSCGLYNKKVVF